MKNRRLFLALVGLVGTALGSAVLVLWLAAPRLESISPAPGSTAVEALAPLRLTFSRSMQPDSVVAHLTITPSRPGSFTWEGNTLVFTPQRSWPGGEPIEVHLLSGARAGGFPGLPVLSSFSWSFTSTQIRLAYLWPADGPADLYSLEPLSGEVRRLTERGNVLDFSPDPQGGALYFSARLAQGGSDIYRLDLAAAFAAQSFAEPALVQSCPHAACQSPRLSPRGDWLAYERTPLAGNASAADIQVWLLPLPSGEPLLVGDASHRTSLPAWSSTGLLAFYNADQQAFLLYDPASQSSRSFPNQTGEPGNWFPDGSAYLAPEIFLEVFELLEPRAASHLMRYPAETGATADLTLENNLEDTSPAVSPDGKTIAFARKYLDTQRWTPGRQLWLMSADGSQARPLTDDPFYNHYAIAWSPDSQRMAFVRFNLDTLTDPPELWLINADGSDALELVVGGYAPQWLP